MKRLAKKTLKAFKEADKICSGKRNVKTYKTANELRKDLKV